MTATQFTEWLTKTIPGIIILGALGSLIAIPLARALRWAFARALNSFLLSHVRPYLLARILVRKYVRQGDSPRLIAWLFVVLGFGAASSAVLFGLFILAAVYFATYGLEHSRLSVTISVALGAYGMLWLRDMFGAFGVFKELLLSDVNGINEELRKPGIAVEALKHFDELFDARPAQALPPVQSPAANVLPAGEHPGA